jgi:CheY-like chemotaxis protein
MSKDRLKVISQTVKKIPLFAGLSPSQIQSILGVCQWKQFEAGTVICAVGSPATEMFILLSGELAVVTQDGTQVAALQPVTTVGELGVFTNQERKATVQTATKCVLLQITKTGFETMLQSNLAVQARIFRNIVDILAGKIVEDNARMSDHLRQRVQHENRVREHRRRTELAVDLLVEEMGIDRDQVQAKLDDQMQHDDRMRILIVDDEEEIVRLMRRTLEDYDTVEAHNGEEALAMLEEQPVDLVITDIRMPDMDGYQLLKVIRKRFPDVRVLAMSGAVTGEDVEEHGFEAFIEKPMDPDGIREIVERVSEKAD